MKKITFIIGLVCLSVALQAQTQAPNYLQYIERYREIAIQQQEDYRIPASISMAQGLLESGAGMGTLAREANNHFGIKCTSDWQGETFLHNDDKKDDCFRKYAKAEDSWNDHSLFLQRSRYAKLFDLAINDYKGWAYGLKECGYATDSKYPEKLIRLIELYHLDALTAEAPATHKEVSEGDTIYAADTVAIAEVRKLQKEAKMNEVCLFHDHKTGWVNGTRYIIVQEGESFETLSYFLNIKEKTLRKMNDAEDGRGVKEGDRIFIYPKKKRADHKHKTYYVRKGDTAWSISQKFGIKMESIYRLNGIQEGIPLVTRQELDLR